MVGTARARRRSRRMSATAMVLAIGLVLFAWLPARAALPEPWVCEPVPGGLRCVNGDEVVLCPANGVGRHECRDAVTPTETPSEEPSPEPTTDPSPEPTSEPTGEPTEEPTEEPTGSESPAPTGSPTPSGEPSDGPSDEPTVSTSESASPTPSPSISPTPEPTDPATTRPSDDPDPGPGPGPDPDPGPGSGSGGQPPSGQQGDERWAGRSVVSSDGHTAINGPVSITTSLITVVPGEGVTLTGSGWLPGSTVMIVLYSTPVVLGTAEVDSNGNFRTTVTIPEDLSLGEHHLVISGLDPDGLPRQVTIPLTAVAAHAADDGSAAADVDEDTDLVSLPATGGTSLVLALEALAALLTGALLVRTTRGPAAATALAVRRPAPRRSGTD
jgi:hexosaminidase